MSNDESPVDVAAINAAPPGDLAPGGESAAEPAAATRRRRATAAPRTPRSRKTATKTPETAASAEAQAVPLPAVIEAQTPVAEPVSEQPAAAKRTTRRAPRKTAKSALEESVPSPSIADAVAEAVTVPDPAPAATRAVVEDAASKPSTSRRRGGASRRRKEPAGNVSQPEPVPVPVEVEAPVIEAAAPAAPGVAETSDEPTSRGRRRTTRGRRRGTSEPVTATQPEVEPAPQPSVAETVPQEMPESGTGRRRRAATPRRRAEQNQLPDRGARLVARKGLVDLVIDGKTVAPFFFFGNMEGAKEQRRVASEVQRAAQAGVHLHSTLIELICPLAPDDTVYEALDTRMQALLEADPQGYLIPRMVFVPAPGWRKQYPNEVNHYADGSTDDPSIASDMFWREAESALRAVVEHVRRMTYGDRVIGYHLERGEWFHPADGGYDRSYANREAFRNWLRQKYKNSEAALRASWYDGQVQFYTAEIPAAPANARPEMAFFEPRKDRRTIDFLEYTSDVTADRLISLSRAIKDASENSALVSVCYGYTYEFGHTFSGHLSFSKVLESPVIDIISGPTSYRDRMPGGAGSLPAPVHSCAVHGKLWVTEDDTKTYLAPAGDSPDDFNPRMENRFLTEQVQERAVGKTLANQTGIAWMDTWGDGWLDSGDVWQSINDGLNRYTSYLSVRKAPAPDVALILGEKSLLHLQRGEAFVRRILHEQRELAQRIGASVGFYLQSDLTARAFPTEAKLYIFLTPYRLTPEQRLAVKEKLQGNGKTLVWLYAPGTCDARGEPEESAHDLVGITLRQQSWNSEVGSRIVESRHPIVQQAQTRTVGVRERLNPSFYVDDESPRLTILGEYQQTGLPSMAVRELDGWRSVFCGEPTLTLDLLRGLCRYAGVHLYTVAGEDYLFAGDGWLTLHAVRDGQKTIFLPTPMAVYDLTENRFLGEDLREVRFFAKAKTTHRVCAGSIETLRKLGFPGVEKTSRTRRGRVTRTAEPLPEPENIETMADELPAADTHLPDEAVVVAVSTDPFADDDREALFEPAQSNGGEPSDEEGDEGGDEAAIPGESEQDRRRRRRRRGGRGRGRRTGRGGAPTGAAAGEGPPSA